MPHGWIKEQLRILYVVCVGVTRQYTLTTKNICRNSPGNSFFFNTESVWGGELFITAETSHVLNDGNEAVPKVNFHKNTPKK